MKGKLPFILLLLVTFANCSSYTTRPPELEPIPDFETGCAEYKGTERSRCIQRLLQELEDIRNPDKPILKVEVNRKRYNEYWVQVEIRYCLSSNLCFTDTSYERKPSFMAKVKEYGMVGGIVFILTVLLVP